jgi:hypothetical protein
VVLVEIKPLRAPPINQLKRNWVPQAKRKRAPEKVSGTDPKKIESPSKEQFNGTECIEQHRISGCAEPIDDHQR